MKIASVLAVWILALVVCSCSTTQLPIDEGLTGPGADDLDGSGNLNPDGVPYPTDNIGTLQRRGSVPGNRIANFKFLGYPDGNVAAGLQPVSLAQYYDPSGSRYRILHIQAGSVWCGSCRAEASAVAPLKAQLDAKKAVWITSLSDGGVPGSKATPKDLELWIETFKSPYTHVLDPRFERLGQFFDTNAVPWNANIDARTMEILTSSTGSPQGAGGIIREIDEAIELANESTLK